MNIYTARYPSATPVGRRQARIPWSACKQTLAGSAKELCVRRLLWFARKLDRAGSQADPCELSVWSEASGRDRSTAMCACIHNFFDFGERWRPGVTDASLAVWDTGFVDESPFPRRVPQDSPRAGLHILTIEAGTSLSMVA